VQVLSLVGSLANFCPGMLVFLALTVNQYDATRWGRLYRYVASHPLPTLFTAGALFVVATDFPFQTSELAAAAQGPLFGLAPGLVLAAFLHGEWTRPVARVLAPIGLASYGVYFWHFVILSALAHHGIAIGPGTGNQVPVAMLCWLLLELPLLSRTIGWERRTIPRLFGQRRNELAGAEAISEARRAPVMPASSRP
jgi:peptidoglycan/LPS O-acetylase OafA/YrhL